MSDLVPNPIEDKKSLKQDKQIVAANAKVGVVGLAVGVAIGWLAKIAFDEGKADDILESLGLDRGNKKK